MECFSPGDYQEQAVGGLTARVELLAKRLSALSLGLISSVVPLAMKALWMTRLGVLLKENTRVTCIQRSKVNMYPHAVHQG